MKETCEGNLCGVHTGLLAGYASWTCQLDMTAGEKKALCVERTRHAPRAAGGTIRLHPTAQCSTTCRLPHYFAYVRRGREVTPRSGMSS